jgi:hypothetical protein
MKVLQILFFALLSSILYSNQLFAQKEYVITGNHDTVFCKIKTESYGDYALAYKYRVNKNDAFIKIDSNIIAYHLANDSAIYFLKDVPGFKFKIYLKRFVNGRINLYAYTLEEPSNYERTMGTAPTYLFADKGEDSFVQISHNNGGILGGAHSHKDEVDAFLNLIADSPKLVEEFKKKKSYNFYYILKYVRAYNAEYVEHNKQPK